MNIDTGRSARDTFCQVNSDLVVYCNGVDANQILNLRTQLVYALGLPAPALIPVQGTSTGTLVGTFLYRVRWQDAKSNTLSLPGPSVSLTLATGTNGIGPDPTDTPPTRATHWILERTSSTGTVFYPVNLDDSTGLGTPIATASIVDNTPDNELLTAQDDIPVVQGVPPPFQWCALNAGILFAGGNLSLPKLVAFQNGNANISSSGYFTDAMDGQTIFDPSTNQFFVIRTIGGLGLTGLLDRVFQGTSGLKPIVLPGGYARNRGRWSQPGDYESWGFPAIGELGNEINVGDAEPLLGGVGVRENGFLWAKKTRLFLHRYTDDPSPLNGGQLFELPERRGVLNPQCIVCIGGGPYGATCYGMDQFGLWRYTTSRYGLGAPEDIGRALRNDWKRNKLNWASTDNWLLQWDPFAQRLIAWVCEGSDVFPRLGYVWDLERSAWVDMLRLPAGRACALQLYDAEGKWRPAAFSAVVPPNVTGATVKSYLFFDGIGSTLGIAPAAAPLTGVITSGDQDGFTVAGATFPTAGEGLAGGVATVIQPGNVHVSVPIASNTGTTLTIPRPLSGGFAQAGYGLELGSIAWRYRSGRIDCGIPDRKKTFKELRLKLRFKHAGGIGTPPPQPVSVFFARFYLDGDTSNPFIDRAVAFNEDGVSWPANAPDAMIDCSNAKTIRARVPLGMQCTDLQFELWGSAPGIPPEILAPLELDFEPDTAKTPRN